MDSGGPKEPVLGGGMDTLEEGAIWGGDICQAIVKYMKYPACS